MINIFKQPTSPTNESQTLARCFSVLWATLLGSVTWHMVMPFMALYLTKFRSASPAEVGIVAGTGPLIQSVFGLVAGYIIDRWGSVRPAQASLLLGAVALIGFPFASILSIFLLLYAALGIFRAIFSVASRVYASQVSKAEERLRVFGYLYVAFNIGAIIGPILAGQFFESNADSLFFAAAAIQGLAFIGFWIFKATSIPHGHTVRIRPHWAIGWRTPGMVAILLANTLVWFSFSQVWVTLPQHLNALNLTSLYPNLLVLNAVLIIATQNFVVRWIEKHGEVFAITTGLASLTIAFSIAAFVQHPSGFFVMMFFVTVGEMNLFPLNQSIVDRLMPAEAKGTAFGLFNLTMVGISLGAVIGSPVLSQWGASVFFAGVAILPLINVLLYRSYWRATRR